jgi:hypothetical protein
LARIARLTCTCSRRLQISSAKGLFIARSPSLY